MRTSIPLYDALAATYDDHFSAPHRRAYDDLCWEHVERLLPSASGLIVDAGCGVGRWASRLVSMGHRVIGIEQAPEMIKRARARGLGPRFVVLEGSMEEVEPCQGEADLVLAMGSLQYTLEPGAALARFASWLRPGGRAVVLVDSLLALVLELWAAGRDDEAELRLRSRRGVWKQEGLSADLHLLDAGRLRCLLLEAGLAEVEVAGVLVGATAHGREGLRRRLESNYDGQLALERIGMAESLLADSGKQLLGTGRRPLLGDDS